MTITFTPEIEINTDVDAGYQQALHTLNEYFCGDDASTGDEFEDLKRLTTIWHGRRCACGTCEDCWLFTSWQGTLAFWVHGDKVSSYSLQCDSLEVTHDAVAA